MTRRSRKSLNSSKLMAVALRANAFLGFHAGFQPESTVQVSAHGLLIAQTCVTEPVTAGCGDINGLRRRRG
jgi:hypothetical protein